MSHDTRSIFREKALKHYMQGHEKVVLPQFISPPVVLFLWSFLVLMLVSGGSAWFCRIPVYLIAQGEVNGQMGQNQQKNLIVVLLPASQLPYLRPGLSVQIKVGSDGPQWSQTVTMIEPKVMSPTEIRQQFHLDGSAAMLVSQPSAVIVLQTAHLPGSMYAGSFVQARILIGYQRVISLLPGLGYLRGE